MTRIKPTVSLFRVWQRELDGVLAHFSTTYTPYYCGYVLTLPWSSCYSRHVTHCDCDCDLTSVTPLWHCDKVMWYFPMLHLIVVNKKRKKKNINNDLANLPSHDRATLACLLVVLKHTSLAPILLTLILRDVYNVEYPSRSLILISEDSPGGELYHNYRL